MIGEHLGKFRIIKWLGGGQFSDVFLAVDTIIEKQVALKIPRQRSKDIEMLKREAKMLIELEHPNILRFFSVDIIDGKVVLVTEFVDGESLRAKIERERKLSQDTAVNIIMQVLDAVQYAHDRGVLHRDIKPENILINSRGIVKVADFGLAGIAGSNSMLLSMAGTPIYMAREMWTGKSTRQSDIYSAGIVLYEMLAGHPPFNAESMEALRTKIFNGRIRKINGIPPFLMKAIRTSTSKRSNHRFKTCNEFKKALIGKVDKSEFKFHPVLKKSANTSSLSGLTEEQKSAVVNGDGITLVIGWAGTGKTLTLTRRVAYLIQNRHVPPSRILAVTFTVKAANRLKEELSTILSDSNMDDLWTGTLHSVGLKIVAKGAERIDFDSEKLTVLNHEDSMQLLTNIMSGNSYNRVKAYLKAIERAKTNLISPENYHKLAGNQWEKAVAQTYNTYQNVMRQRNLIDFGDIIYYAVKILTENRDLLTMFSTNFKHVLVDEFQDIDTAQFQLLKLLSSRHKNLFITGDDDQSIYTFRGAKPDFIRDLENVKSEHVKRFYLTASFRVPDNILVLANNLLSHNKDKIPKIMISLSKTQGEVIYKDLENERSQAVFVADTVSELKDKGYNYEDMAVIFRLNSQSRNIEEAFFSKGIPFNIIGKGGFYERDEIKALTAVLKFAHGCATQEDISIMLKKFLRNLPGYDNLSDVQDIIYNKLTNKTFNESLYTSKMMRDANLACKFLENIKKQALNREITPLFAVEKVINKWKYIDKLKNEGTPAKQQEYENIMEMMEFLSKFSFNEFGKAISEINVLQKLSIESETTNGVAVMTAHKCKGLEFPVVFAIGLVDGVFPLLKNTATIEDIEEERRLFYVTITRAQETLYLLRPRKRRGYTANVSRFVTEMYLKATG